MKIRCSFFVVAWVGLVVTGAQGCASTVPGARPDDMSAEAHRKAAQREEGKAEQHEAQYDPTAEATRTRTRSVGGTHPEAAITTYEQTYNPTEGHLGVAEEHSEHAAQHRDAAQALESFEEAECESFSKSVRSTCPLLGGVIIRVERIDGGARVILQPDINAEVAAAHMRCHYAFGRKAGRKGMPECPLYLEDINIEVSNDNAVDITASQPAIVEEVRSRIATHLDS